MYRSQDGHLRRLAADLQLHEGIGTPCDALCLLSMHVHSLTVRGMQLLALQHDPVCLSPFRDHQRKLKHSQVCLLASTLQQQGLRHKHVLLGYNLTSTPCLVL